MKQSSPYFDDLEATRAEIRKHIAKWQPVMLVGWNVSVDWNLERNKDTPDCAMETSVDWTRCSGSLRVYLPACERARAELEAIVIHEFTHFLVNEMRMWEEAGKTAIRHEERVVTIIANLIHQLSTRAKQ